MAPVAQKTSTARLLAVLALATAVLAACVAQASAAPQASVWSYGTQSKWPGMCASGMRQSPIDISFSDNTVVYDNALRPIGFRGFRANVPKNTLTVSNNGKTLVAAVNPQSRIKVMGGFFPEAYTIAQINLHWGSNNDEGSDHTINGKKYPLEAHFVGYRGSSLKAAVTSSEADALVELAVMFKIGAPNPTIQAMIDAVKAAKVGERVPITKDVSLGAMIPFAASTEYVTYLGSLSTPPCTQNVNWVVFRNFMTISEEQLAALRSLRGADNKPMTQTFRAVQALNGRIVRASFPFVVRQNIPSVVSTPIGHVVTNVNSVTSPAVGAPDPIGGPSPIPVVDVPAPKVPVKNVVVAANQEHAIGSTSTTINVTPMDANNPNGPQKIESVVKSTAAHPLQVAAANVMKQAHEQAQAIEQTKAAIAQAQANGQIVFASPPTLIPPHLVAAAHADPLKPLVSDGGHLNLGEPIYVETEAELKAKVAEANAELTEVSDFARKAREEQLRGVTEANGVQYIDAQLSSFVESEAQATNKPIDLAKLDKTPTQTKPAAPKRPIILDEPINVNFTKPLTDEEKEAAKKVKKAKEADRMRIHEWAFDTYRVVHQPLVSNDTVEAAYAPFVGWPNNTKPEVPTGDKIGLYNTPDVKVYQGRQLFRVKNFGPSWEKYAEVEYLPEEPKLPDLGFKFPSLKHALKQPPYEVDGTVTSLPNPNEIYEPPTGPLTRRAGTSMLPKKFYGRRNYPVINPDVDARKHGLEYAKSEFELTRKDAQYSAIPDNLVAYVTANPPANEASFGTNTASFAEIDAQTEHPVIVTAAPVIAPVAPVVSLNAKDVADAVVQDRAGALAAYRARLLAAEAERSEFLRALARQNWKSANVADLIRYYNAIRAHIERTLPAAITDLSAYQNARYAAAATAVNANGAPVFVRDASYNAMVSQAQLFQKAREQALRDHLTAVADHLRELAARDRIIASKRATQAEVLGAIANAQVRAVDAATKPLADLPPLTDRINSLLSAVETISSKREAEANAAAPAQAQAQSELEQVRAQREQAEAQLKALYAMRDSLRNAQSNLQSGHPEVDTALAEAINNIETLHAHQTAAISAQANTVNALANSRNAHATAQAKAALKTMKDQAKSTLSAEAEALARLAELKRQTAAQEAELKAHKEKLAAMRAQEATLKTKLEEANAALAKREQANKAEEQKLAEEKKKIAQQKEQIKKRMRRILKASRKLRATAVKLQQEQAQRVQQSIAKSLAATSETAKPAAKKVSPDQVSKDWQAQVDATRHKIAKTLSALKAEGASDAEIEELARAADM